MLFAQRTPLYIEVAGQIVGFIKEGEYENNILPSEDLLSKQLGISRNTLREALAELTNQGIINKRQGIGNLVMRSALDTKFRIDLKIDFTRMLQELGFVIRSEQSYSRIEMAEIGTIKEEALVYDEILYANEDVAAIMHIAIPARTLIEEIPPELPKKSFFKLIFSSTKEVIAHSLVQFEAVTIPSPMCLRFGIDEGTSVISWIERFQNMQDECISMNRIYFNPRIFKPAILRNGFYQDDLVYEIPCTTHPSLDL
jgi:DNA-binding GntR family transcriptional regulator